MNIGQVELDRYIADHQLYVRSGHSAGTRIELTGASFVGLDFRGADLFESIMYGCDFTRANLNGTNLSCSILEGSQLQGVHIDSVDMYKADLSDSDLAGATLSRTRLDRTDFHGANLRGVTLTECRMMIGTSFAAADLRGFSIEGSQVDLVLADAVLENNTFAGVRGFVRDNPAFIESPAGRIQISGPELVDYMNGRGAELSLLRSLFRGTETLPPGSAPS